MIPPITRVIPLIKTEKETFPQLIENTQTFGTLSANKEQSINYVNFAHYLKEKGFNTISDKVIAAAYYISEIKGITNFTRDDIITELKTAKVPALTNISDVIARCIKKAFINENNEKIDNKRSFCIVQPGIEYCLSYVPKEDTSKKTSKIAKNKSTKDYPSLNVTVDDLHMEKYCNITELTKVDEQLWVLIYMYTKETEFQSFTRKELQKIMKEKFNLSLTDKQVRRFFEQSGTSVDKTMIGKEQAIRLLQGGFKKAEEIINNNNRI